MPQLVQWLADARSAPGVPRVPAGHIVHDICPVLAWKRPMLHRVHAVLPAVSANVPRAHGVTARPSTQRWPGGHGVQLMALVRYEPGPHVLHAPWPAASWYSRVAVQATQEVAPVPAW